MVQTLELTLKTCKEVQITANRKIKKNEKYFQIILVDIEKKYRRMKTGGENRNKLRKR